MSARTYASDEALYSLARQLARVAHEGQTRRDGEPYFNHVERVAIRARARFGTRAGIIGYLHDLAEDTTLTTSSLEEIGFPPAIVAAVAALTRRGTELLSRGYAAYIDRLINSGLIPALQVKLTDLDDNLRGPASLTAAQREQRERYRDAKARITAELAAWTEPEHLGAAEAA